MLTCIDFRVSLVETWRGGGIVWKNILREIFFRMRFLTVHVHSLIHMNSALLFRDSQMPVRPMDAVVHRLSGRC